LADSVPLPLSTVFRSPRGSMGELCDARRLAQAPLTIGRLHSPSLLEFLDNMPIEERKYNDP
jgi:hypothetical protein